MKMIEIKLYNYEVDGHTFAQCRLVNVMTSLKMYNINYYPLLKSNQFK